MMKHVKRMLMTIATVLVVPNSTRVVVVIVVISVTRVIGVAVCGCVVVESAKKRV